MCRDRHQITTVDRGVITETEFMAPVTLGFSDASVSSECWEEVYDLEGFPTGVEVLEIGVRRLTVGDGENLVDDGYEGMVQNRLERKFVERNYVDDVRKTGMKRRRVSGSNPRWLTKVMVLILWAIMSSMWQMTEGVVCTSQSN